MTALRFMAACTAAFVLLGAAGCGTAPMHPALVEAQKAKRLPPLVPLRRFVSNVDDVGGFALSPDGMRPQSFSEDNRRVILRGTGFFDLAELLLDRTNWPPFWHNRHYFARTFGDVNNPRERGEMLANSPISHLDKITAPLLVIQGANDVRAQRQDSDDVVGALKARGRPVEYLLFEDTKATASASGATASRCGARARIRSPFAWAGTAPGSIFMN